MFHSAQFRRFFILFGFLFCAFVTAATGQISIPELTSAEWIEQQPAPGIQLRQKHFENLFGYPQFISVITVKLDQTNAEVRFAATQQFGAVEMTVPELAEKTDALFAINGGFFDATSNANCGILKIDGNVLPFRKKEEPELHFVGSSAVGIDSHGEWHFKIRDSASWTDDWKEMRDALAGGHPLILNGEIRPELQRTSYESQREVRHALSRHPRTAIGLSTNRFILLITADGRHPGQAEGLTVLQTAQLMKALGCKNAINLDGGGSTTMWQRGKGIINHPSDNKKFDPEGARAIRTAVIVTTKNSEGPAQKKE